MVHQEVKKFSVATPLADVNDDYYYLLAFFHVFRVLSIIFVLDYFVKLSCKSCLFYICVSVCPFHAFVADKDWQDGLQIFGKFC